MNLVNLILISNVSTTDIMTTGAVDKDEFYTYASAIPCLYVIHWFAFLPTL